MRASILGVVLHYCFAWENLFQQVQLTTARVAGTSLLFSPLTTSSLHAPLTTFYLYIFIYTPPMKSIRKSFGSSKETHISSPLPPLSKPALAIQPPIKVIRALQSHKSQSPHQLSFEKGDFFHVLKDPEDGLWYEASNPSTSARGLVPVHMFEEFLKGSATCVCLLSHRRKLYRAFPVVPAPRCPQH